MDKKYQVFVSSTYKDLISERAAVIGCLLDMECIPVGMEQFPASPLSQWEYITKIIDSSDYYLLILAGKYGSIDEETDIGYTEKEYNYAKEKGIPIIAFLHGNLSSIPVNKFASTDYERNKLNDFRKLIETDGQHINYYESEDDLKYKVARSIPKLIEDVPAVGWVRADQIENIVEESPYVNNLNDLKDTLGKMQDIILNQIQQTKPKWNVATDQDVQELFVKSEKNPIEIPSISDEAKELLKFGVEDTSGQILRISSLEGIYIQINDKEMIPDRKAKTIAIWEDALKELVDLEFVRPLGNRNELFQITRKGYEVAEKI